MAHALNNTDDLSQNIRDQFLQCKICLDGLKAPKTLPCLHTFCYECIVYYIEHNRIDNRKFSCPICRRHIYIPKSGADGFPDSFFVSNLEEMVDKKEENSSNASSDCGICKFKGGGNKAEQLCIECKTELCGECVTSHQAAKVTATHTLMPIKQQARRDNYCRAHKGEVIKFYCEKCNAAICLPCTFLDHKGHEVVEIRAVRDTVAQDMEELIAKSSSRMLQLTASKDDLLDLENELFMRKEAVKADMQRAIQELIRTVNAQKSRLMARIDEFYDTISLAKDRQNLEKIIYRLQRAHGYAADLLSADTSPITQINNKTDAMDGLRRALDYDTATVAAAARHSDMLHKYVYFMPGNLSVELGSLLKCTAPGHSTTVTEYRHVMPTNTAMFLHKLRAYDEPLGEVLAVTIAPNTDIILLTTLGKKVKIFSGSTGSLKYEFGDDDDLLHPTDVAVTRDGDIAVTDANSLAVKIYDPYGALKMRWGDERLFSLPISITTDDLGRLLVCDQVKQCVTIHRTTGELIQKVHITEVATPTQIACRSNKLYVCDADNKTVTIYFVTEDEMQFVARLSTPSERTGQHGEFLDCSGINTDRHGNLLIADMALDKIHVWSARGEMSALRCRGRPLLRPMAVATSPAGLMAVVQHGVFPLDTDMPASHDVLVYRVVKADV